jgi:hypothetical protein
MLSSPHLTRLAEQLDSYTHLTFLDGSFDIEFSLTRSSIARFDMETCQSELFKTLKLRSKLIYGKRQIYVRTAMKLSHYCCPI